MIYINSMFNQDAGIPIFPMDYLEDISKYMSKGEEFDFIDLNLEVYNKLATFEKYSQIKHIFGGYYSTQSEATPTYVNEYRFEAMPTVELLTALIYYRNVDNINVETEIIKVCKEYGLNKKNVEFVLAELLLIFKDIASEMKQNPCKEITLYMDSVSSVATGLLFLSFFRNISPTSKVTVTGNQVNVPEIANYALSLDLISTVINIQTEKKLENPNQLIKVLTYMKKKIINYPLYHGVRIIPFKLTEGCTQNCNFCTERMSWDHNGNIIDKFKSKNLNNCLEILNFILREMNVDGISFNDCMINFELPQYKNLVKLIESNHIFCSGSTRIDCLNYNNINILKRMNFTNLIIGIESFDSSSVDIYHKGNDKYLNNFFEIFALLKLNGIEPQINIVIDHPYETEEMVLKSIESNRLSLEYMRNHHLNILDLSVGEMLINYPSENYFNICNDENFQIEYHDLNSDKFSSSLVESVKKIPFKAFSKHQSFTNKIDVIVQLNKTMDFEDDLLKRIETIVKHWNNFNYVWSKNNITIQLKNEHTEVTKPKDNVLYMLLERKRIKYSELILNFSDREKLVTELLILSLAGLIEFFAER